MVLLSEKKHRHIFLFGLSALAIAVPTSVFLMSVAQFVLFFNWTLEPHFFDRIKRFLKNKAAIIFSLIFLIHVFGLLYTTDFNYALKDLRTKIPLLLLPLIIVTTPPLSKKELSVVLLLFVLTVVVSTFFSIYHYLFVEFNDVRQLSVFISHIRFSLLICFAICIIIYFFYKKIFTTKYLSVFCVVGISWLLLFLFLFESITGLSILLFLFLLFLVVFFVKSSYVYYKILSATVFFIITFFSIAYISSSINSYYDVEDVNFNNLEHYTSKGNKYYHDFTSMQAENGHLIWIYISDEELKEEWEKASSYPYYEKDDKGQYLPGTLIRFMASKGLRKDAEGFKQLDENEIRAIERGIASVSFFDKLTLKKRIHEIIYEYNKYKSTGNASGMSVMMRFEFFKTSLDIINNNFLFGVGTGDVNAAFKKQYEKNNTLLEPKFRWRSHNQYLSIFVAFGLFGFLIFLLGLFYPIFALKKYNNYLYVSFLLIMLISMLTEDTLETQAGVTIFAFFNTIFLFGIRNDDKQDK